MKKTNFKQTNADVILVNFASILWKLSPVKIKIMQLSWLYFVKILEILQKTVMETQLRPQQSA